MKNAKLFTLGFSDFVKGLFMAVLGAVAGAVTAAIQSGNPFNWKMIGTIALTAFLTYLTKNFLTNSKDQLLTKEPPDK